MSERDNAIRFLSKMSCYFLSERVLIKVVCSCLSQVFKDGLLIFKSRNEFTRI